MTNIKAESRIMLVAWVLVDERVTADVLRDVTNACLLTESVELGTDWRGEDGMVWRKLLTGLGEAKGIARFGEGVATEVQVVARGSGGAAWRGDAAWSWSSCAGRNAFLGWSCLIEVSFSLFSDGQARALCFDLSIEGSSSRLHSESFDESTPVASI